MKKIKIGVMVVFFTAIIYFFVSYAIFMWKKSLLDEQLQPVDQQVIIQNMAQVQKLYDQDVMVVQHDLQYHTSNSDQSIDFIITSEPEQSLAIIAADKEHRFVAPGDDAEQVQRADYSFVTMPLPELANHEIHKYLKLDAETQESLDILIGNDFNRFVSLILQSNNDIVSQQVCRSCGLYALCKKVKHHKPLTTQEVKTLQHIIANLYRFVETMNKLSKSFVMSSEQYVALQDLNKPQVVKDAMKLQARKAAATAALKKLQSLTYHN